MHPADTNTKIVRTAEVLKHLQSQHNAAGHYEYVARHATAEDAPPGSHWPRHAMTEQIPAAVVRAALETPATQRVDVTRLDVRLPLPPRPAVPRPVEPVAEVTVPLLERVLGGLRKWTARR